MTRGHISLIAVLAVAATLLLDRAAAPAPDPFNAPPLLAWGSGQAAGGAFCAALPE